MKRSADWGKYRLLERLSVGGMAEVFVAKSFGVEGFERILAIKKILPAMAADEEFINMFKDEARIAVQLAHANIVQVHELGKHDDTFYIAMEYVSGRDLRTLLERYRERGEIMPSAQAVFIASKMCEGLDYAHRKRDARGQPLNIIHRDVSPQNILVSYEGEVKIIDFGIAKAANRSQRTQAGILKGKFGYMSPEQVRGAPIDRRADVFAVGVILYEMLTGEKLFVGESDFSKLERVRNAEVPSLRQFNPALPPGLERVVLKALEREPDHRYQWASDLQEDLMRFLLAGETIYSAKHLASFMREAFAAEIEEEAQRMSRFAALRPAPSLDTGSLPSLQSSDEILVTSASYLPRLEADSVVSQSVERTEVAGEPVEEVVERTRLSPLESTLPPQPRPAPGKLRVVISGNHAAYSGATMVGPVPEGPADSDSDSSLVPSTKIIGERPRYREEESELGGEIAVTANQRAPAEAAAGYDEESSNGSGVALGAESPPPTQADHPPAIRPSPAISRPRVRQSARSQSVGRSRRALLFVGAIGLVGLGVGLAMLFGPPATGSVVLRVTPADAASVTIGGQPVTNDAEVTLPVGEYELVASAPGHQVQRHRVEIRPDALTPIVLQLTPTEPAAAPALPPNVGEEPAPTDRALSQGPSIKKSQTYAARLVSDVAGVDLYVDGRWVGKAPRTVTGLIADRAYRVEGRRYGYRRFSEVLRSSGETPEVSFQVEMVPHRTAAPKVASDPRAPGDPRPERPETAGSAAPPAGTGTLICATSPAGAEVWVDGRATKRETPVSRARPIELPVGQHKVELKWEDRPSVSHTVIIRHAGEEVRCD